MLAKTGKGGHVANFAEDRRSRSQDPESCFDVLHCKPEGRRSVGPPARAVPGIWARSRIAWPKLSGLKVPQRLQLTAPYAQMKPTVQGTHKEVSAQARHAHAIVLNESKLL